MFLKRKQFWMNSCIFAIITVIKLWLYYPCRLCRSVWVGFSSQSVCQHNSKTNDPKVFKLGVGNDLGIP